MTDRGNTVEHWNEIWSHPQRHVEKYSMRRAWWHIQKTEAQSILDVGCGNGRLLCGIKEGRRVFGIDFSPTAIERMKREYDIDGAVMNIYDLHELQETFDFVVINHTLEHLWKDEDVVQKCYDRLNSGGTFFASVPNSMSGPEETEEHVRSYNKETLKALIERVFGNCTIEVIHHHLIGIAKK